MVTRGRRVCADKSWIVVWATHDAPGSNPCLPQPAELADTGVTTPRTTAQIKPSGAKLAADLSIINPSPMIKRRALRGVPSTAWLASKPPLQHSHEGRIQLANLRGTFPRRH